MTTSSSSDDRAQPNGSPDKQAHNNPSQAAETRSSANSRPAGGKKGLVVGGCIALALVVGFALLLSGPGRPSLDLSQFPEQIESSVGILRDINTMAFHEARKHGDMDVVVATEILVDSLDRASLLGLSNAPTESDPLRFGFQFRMFPGQAYRTGPENMNLYMSPILAWPVLMERHPDMLLPVFVTLPQDPFVLSGGKSIRCRWMTWKELEPFLVDRPSFNPDEWSMLRRDELRGRLEALAK